MIAAVNPAVRSRMLSFALSITKHAGEAESLVEDTIVKVAETVDLAKVPGSKLVSYLMTVLRNMAFSWFRHDRVVRAHLEVCREEPVRSALAETISREAVEYFKILVAGLPRAFRKVLVLRVVEELSYGEISKKLRIPVGTVMSRIFRARRSLEKFSRYVKA